MKEEKRKAVLFDLDGVVLDTETQYTLFWDKQGEKYLGIKNFCCRIKGQTLTQIFEAYFAAMPEARLEIVDRLNAFEKEMAYEYIPGAVDFMLDLHRHGVKSAIVTSSNEAKMEHVYRAHPELKELVDVILTGEMFERSKPAPDCFLLGMKRLCALPEDTYVFEDSFHGLQAGMDCGAYVVGLATTNPADAIAGKAHFVIDDFRGMTYDKLLELHR